MADKIIIFPSVHFTLSGENLLKANEIEHLVIPVPPYINEGCGLGIRLSEENASRAIILFEQKEIKIEKIIAI